MASDSGVKNLLFVWLGFVLGAYFFASFLSSRGKVILSLGFGFILGLYLFCKGLISLGHKKMEKAAKDQAQAKMFEGAAISLICIILLILIITIG